MCSTGNIILLVKVIMDASVFNSYDALLTEKGNLFIDDDINQSLF